MSQAVDIINFHFYITEEQPETDLPPDSLNHVIKTIKNDMNATDNGKPLWNGEGGCGATKTPHIWLDDYSKSAFVPRYMALLWSGGVVESMWYIYTASVPWCALNDLNSSPGSNTLTPAGVAWNTTYNWPVGATLANNPFCSDAGTIWTCALIEANGNPAELAWDSQFGPGGTTAPVSCTDAQNPMICGNTLYTVPAKYTHDWVDIQGRVHPFQPIATVGAMPILLE